MLELGEAEAGLEFLQHPDADKGTTQLDGNDFNITINTGGQTYSGPGTYHTEFGGAFGAGGVNFLSGQATAASQTVVINADGSGSYTFSNMPAVTGSDTASGSFTWTCA